MRGKVAFPIMNTLMGLSMGASTFGTVAEDLGDEGLKKLYASLNPKKKYDTQVNKELINQMQLQIPRIKPIPKIKLSEFHSHNVVKKSVEELFGIKTAAPSGVPTYKDFGSFKTMPELMDHLMTDYKMRPDKAESTAKQLLSQVKKGKGRAPSKLFMSTDDGKSIINKLVKDRHATTYDKLMPFMKKNWGKLLLGGGAAVGAGMLAKNYLEGQRDDRVYSQYPQSLVDRFKYYNKYPIKTSSFIKESSGLFALGKALLGMSAMGAGVGAVTSFGKHMMSAVPVSDEKLMAITMTIKTQDPLLMDVPPEDIYSILKSIKTYSPSLLRDPGALIQTVKTIHSFGGIGVDMIDKLTKIESQKQKAVAAQLGHAGSMQNVFSSGQDGFSSAMGGMF